MGAFDGRQLGGDYIRSHSVKMNAAPQPPMYFSAEGEERMGKLFRALGMSKADWSEALAWEAGTMEVHDATMLLLESIVERVNKLQPGCMYCGDNT